MVGRPLIQPRLNQQSTTHRVRAIFGTTTDVLPTQRLGLDEIYYHEILVNVAPALTGPTVRVPLGRPFGTRSGDKGGNANCGVWALSDESYSFLNEYLTVDEFKRLVPDFWP